MQVDVLKTGDQVRIVLVGQVDTVAGQELSAAVEKVMADTSIRHAVFDLRDVPAMGSSGIGKLLRFFKHFDKLSGSMRIQGISAPLKRQFLEIHLNQIIPIED